MLAPFGSGGVLAYTSDPAPHWGCNFVFWDHYAAFWQAAVAWLLAAQRQPLLEANLKLEILRFQMRLAKDLQCLKPQSYAFAAKAIDEVGRLIGGWLRSRSDKT